ncbi:unnamed protein product [Victoria cruziana]
MKRKRGLKTKHKKSSVVGNVAPFAIASAKEDESVADDTCGDSEGALNYQSESGSPFLGAGEISSDRHHGMEDIKEKATERPGYGRVRVKLKSSKSISLAQEPVQNSPVSLNGDIIPNERFEDGTSLLSESETVSGKSSKKFGSIKIKSSRSSGTSSASFPDKQRVELQTVAEKTKLKEICKDPRYNERELTAALGVIKKIMKMDAAYPFNTPVNPVALGIPDYFDIIDTPMDFGTICAELELGKKYMNSEDVYKDVQYIWGNCYKYNNKGDYILDLMKRVKKNFTKYWTAAGLYSPKKGTDVRQGDDRKANISEDAYGRSDVLDLPMTSSAASHSLQESPTEMAVDQSLENKLNADVHVDGVIQLGQVQQFEEYSRHDENEGVKNSLMITAGLDFNEGNGDPRHVQEVQMEKSEELILQDEKDDKENWTKGKKSDSVGDDHEEEGHLQKASSAKDDFLSPEDILNLPYSEVLHMCGTLFSGDTRSVWGGPHSLNYRKVPVQDSAIHSAIATFMKID